MEKWKPIPNRPRHLVSDFGNVKTISGKVLSSWMNTNGYLNVTIWDNKRNNNYQVHQLVAMGFLNHNPDGHKITVDHKDNDKMNNKLDNLQLLSNRENNSKDRVSKSGFTGVYWSIPRQKWYSQIMINGRTKHLGMFHCKLEAKKVRDNKLKQIL